MVGIAREQSLARGTDASKVKEAAAGTAAALDAWVDALGEAATAQTRAAQATAQVEQATRRPCAAPTRRSGP